MRLRNKKWTGDFLINHQNYLVNWDEKSKIEPQVIFNNQNPVYLEIGSGKGQFLIQNALENPKINFLGMEKEKTVVAVALKKYLQRFETKNELQNLRFINKFAESLLAMFDENSFEKIYLNFSDPWPKAKQAKRRLTNSNFLEDYAKVLKPKGYLEFKTDNEKLFTFTLEEVAKQPNWKIIIQTTNLYDNPELLKNNIPTEYEQKFHNQGKTINKLILQNNK